MLGLVAACADDPAGEAEVAATRIGGQAPRADQVLGGDGLELAISFADGLRIGARIDGDEGSVALSARRIDGRAPVLTAAHARELRAIVARQGGLPGLAADEREAIAIVASRLVEVPPGTDLEDLARLTREQAQAKRGRHDTRAGWVSLCGHIGKEVVASGDGLASSRELIGPPPYTEDCFGRCGWGCDWRWLKNRYTQDCADHDACSRDLGWTSRQCLGSLAGTFDDAFFAPNCF